MREVYQEWIQLEPEDQQILLRQHTAIDPFFESQENHALIGVANVFLEVLFHDVKLDYHVPIISQQGEVAGRLHVEIYRTGCSTKSTCDLDQNGFMERTGSTDSLPGSSSSTATNYDAINNNLIHHVASSNNLSGSGSGLASVGHPFSEYYGKTITCRLRIKEATGLPPNLSHFVFCQYNFWSSSGNGNDFNLSASDLNLTSSCYTVVPPTFDPNQAASNTVHKAEGLAFQFNHEKDFEVYINDEFLEHVQEDALSIQVWGHRTSGLSCMINSHRHCNGVGAGGTNRDQIWDVDDLQGNQNRTLQERWAEVTRRLRMWIEVHELNDHGQYAPVKVQKQGDVLTGGVYNLRQGQQRRLVIGVTPTNDYGSLPLVCEEIVSVSVGCICVRNKQLQKPLDSYQDLDLEYLRQKWGDALSERKQYLDGQIQRLINKPDKSEVDVEREQSLIAQWVALTEERNAVYVPAPNSNVPGAPADWDPPAGMEQHIPVIYLDLKDGLSDGTDRRVCALLSAGAQSILPKERNGKMYHLDLLSFNPEETSVVASWDSSVHEHAGLNKVTQPHEKVYVLVKVQLKLSHPAELLLTLRKRLCVHVSKAPSFAVNWLKRFVSTEYQTGTGLFYDIVAHVPKSSLDPEARETLALMAARSQDANDSAHSSDGESYIEKYTRGISEVESILALDRLRQEVAIRELLGASVRRTMKKTTSLPIAESLRNPNLSGLIPRSESTGMDKFGPCFKEDRSGVERSNLITNLTSPALRSLPSSKKSLGSLKEEQSLEFSCQKVVAPVVDAKSDATVKFDNGNQVKAVVNNGTVSDRHEKLILKHVVDGFDNGAELSIGDAATTSSLASSGYGSQNFLAKASENDCCSTDLKEPATETDSTSACCVKENNNNFFRRDYFLPDNTIVMETSTYSDYEAQILNVSSSTLSGN